MTPPGLVAPLKVDSVRVIPDERDRLLGFGLDFPPANSSSEVYAFKTVGWVIGKTQPVTAVELVHGGSVVRRGLMVPRPDVAARHIGGVVDGANSGFWLSVGVLGLPTQANLELWVTFADGDRLKVAEFRVKHRPVWSSYRPRLRPLMVTSLGRTGTTFMMRLLSQHPQVVVHQTVPYEVRVARYWMHMLKVLTEPENAWESTHPDRFPYDRNFIGHNPFYGGYLGAQGKLMRWLGADYMEHMAAFVLQAIDEFYEKIAIEQRQEGALFFGEKALPDHLAAIAWDLYPDGKEVFLVRDPRDVVCSVLAFNAKRGFVTFGRETVEDDFRFIDLLATQMQVLADSWHLRRDRSMLVRYEDLILDPVDTLAEIAQYVGLDGAPPLLIGIVQRASTDTPELKIHRTVGEPAESIGRWKRDMTPDLKEHCDQAFEKLLDEFGYARMRSATSDGHRAGDLAASSGEPQALPKA